MSRLSSKPKSSPGERLSSKRQLNLIASIAADLSKCGLKPLSSAVLLSLACRGLLPEKLIATPVGWLLERLSQDYFEVETMRIDSSELANCLITPAERAEEELIDAALLDKSNFGESERTLETFKSAGLSFSTPMTRETIADPLFCGWLYQALLMARKDYSDSRMQKATDSLSRITQWFTPSWICNFLLDECFFDNTLAESDEVSLPLPGTNSSGGDSVSYSQKGNHSSHDPKTVTFLDSACGAGHILAPALFKLLAQRLTSPPSNQRDVRAKLDLSEAATAKNTFTESNDISIIKNFDQRLVGQHLTEILASQLYGLDTDPLMVRLSGLAIYLSCRDVNHTAPLPVPLLFSFKNGSESGSVSAALSSRSSEQRHSPSAWKPNQTATASTADDNPANPVDSNFANGSLLLSLDPRPDQVMLRRIDGSAMTLNSLPKTFDLQTLNPPYLSHRLMPKASGQFLREHYDGSQYDLYTAFLELSIRLMAPRGRLAMICQQSFLNTSRFEHLRRRLIERCHINSIVQLGAGAFASRGGEKVSNAIISLSQRNGDAHAKEVSVYKLVSAEAKKEAEEEGVREYEKQTIKETELLATTRTIPGFPLVPFCPGEVVSLFQSYPTISQCDQEIILTNGLFTCDNKRFVRHFSEINDADRSSFVPYDKGGGQKWFSTTPYFIEWKNGGDDIREFRFQRGQSKALPGERYYFQRGITYSYIGTRGFKARLLSPGSVFDIASSAMFCQQIDLFYLLGFLNSSLTRFILGMLNPTVNFQIGDLRRIPFCSPAKPVELEVARLAREAVDLAREAEKFDRTSPAHDPTLNSESLSSRIALINQTESLLQNEIDEIIFKLYKISDTTRDIICKNEWVARTQGDLVQMPGS